MRTYKSIYCKSKIVMTTWIDLHKHTQEWSLANKKHKKKTKQNKISINTTTNQPNIQCCNAMVAICAMRCDATRCDAIKRCDFVFFEGCDEISQGYVCDIAKNPCDIATILCDAMRCDAMLRCDLN